MVPARGFTSALSRTCSGCRSPGAIFQPRVLTDFHKTGFNPPSRNAILKERHPDRFIVDGAFDPRDGERGLDDMAEQVEKHGIKGVKLYTAYRRMGESRGYKLYDPWAERDLAHAAKLGIKNRARAFGIFYEGRRGRAVS